MASSVSGWFRRRSPRLSGTLHIRDADGHELTVPLRGRATLLTTDGAGLRGHGEAWAVHTTTPGVTTTLMIIYGRGRSTENRRSGLCSAGQTITLDGVDFTWRDPSAVPLPMPPAPSAPGAPARLPRPRAATGNAPRHLRTPAARVTNARSEPAGAGSLRGRLRNMVRIVTQATRL